MLFIFLKYSIKMNNLLNDPKMMIGLGVIVFSVLIYFYVNYQVNIAIKAEFSKMKKQKQLKIAKQAQLQKRQQRMQERMGRNDQDSYYDPAEENIGEQQEEDNEDMIGQNREDRLTKDNILMRDMLGM
jgi:hypothetical protein